MARRGKKRKSAHNASAAAAKIRKDQEMDAIHQPFNGFHPKSPIISGVIHGQARRVVEPVRLDPSTPMRDQRGTSTSSNSNDSTPEWKKSSSTDAKWTKMIFCLLAIISVAIGGAPLLSNEAAKRIKAEYDMPRSTFLQHAEQDQDGWHARSQTRWWTARNHY